MKPMISSVFHDPVVHELLPVFGRLLNERSSELRRMLDLADMPKLRTAAHSLKGSALMYGFDELAAAAAAVEQEALSGQSAGVGDRIDRIEHLAERILAGISGGAR